MKKLIDVSNAQSPKNVDVKKIKEAGIDGVYIRCGEGVHDKDPAFLQHVVAFHDAGFRVGAYYVLAPSGKDPIGAAHHALETSQYSSDMLPLCIDVERNRPLGADAPIWADYLTKFDAALSGEFVHYTYKSFYQELTTAHYKSSKPWFLAAYPTLHYPDPQAEQLRKNAIAAMAEFNVAIRKGDSKAALNAAMRRKVNGLQLSKLGFEPEPLGMKPADAIIWQWGGDANASTCHGVQGFCDRSYFLGTDEEWDNFYQFPQALKHVDLFANAMIPITRTNK